MSEVRDRALPTINPVRDNADRVTFILSVVVGTAGIVSLREYGIDPLLVILLPVGLIVSYAAVALWSKRLQLREDRIADNCYYMGFIFTLVSLAYALYGFQYGGTVTDKLIQDFGIALTSTIFGVIMRLILNQFRTDAVEIEREARLELSDTARALRSEMQQAVEDFKGYRVGMHQTFEEAMQQAQESAGSSMTTASSRFEEVAETLVARIESSFEAHAENARRLTEASGQTVDALEGVVDRIEKIEAPNDLVAQKLAPAVEQIREAADAVNKRAAADGREVARLTKMIDGAVQGMEALGERLEQAENHARTEAMTREEVAKDLTAMRDSASAIHEAAHESRNIVAKGREAAEAHERVLTELREAASTTISEMKRHNNELATALGESRRMTLQVHAELTELANTITRRLDGSALEGGPA